MSDTPHTDNMARGEHVVPTWFAQELEREMAKAHKAQEQLKERIKELTYENENLYRRLESVHEVYRLSSVFRELKAENEKLKQQQP